MSLKTYPDVPQYAPIITKSFVATATTASVDYHEFVMERPVTNAIAQIQAKTTGAENATGLAVVITTVTTAGSESCTVKVAATAITADDVINLIAW